MASLCISEFLGHGSGGDLERTLDQEIRRSVAVFNALQELLEVRRSSSAVECVCLTELLQAKLMEPMFAEGGVTVALPETLLCRGSRKALERAVALLLAASLRARSQGGTMSIRACRLGEAIEVRALTESVQGVAIAAELRADANPFEGKSFDFHRRAVPEIAIVQQGLEASGGDLRIEATATSLTFVLLLPPAPMVPRM